MIEPKDELRTVARASEQMDAGPGEPLAALGVELRLLQPVPGLGFEDPAHILKGDTRAPVQRPARARGEEDAVTVTLGAFPASAETMFVSRLWRISSARAATSIGRSASQAVSR